MLIELTPSGCMAAHTIREAFAGVERRALGNLPAEAVAVLRQTLQAVTEVSS